MSISEIKAELERMPLEDRRQLTAFLVSLRHRELSGYRDQISEKIDDRDPAHWVSFEEFDLRVSAQR